MAIKMSNVRYRVVEKFYHHKNYCNDKTIRRVSKEVNKPRLIVFQYCKVVIRYFDNIITTAMHYTSYTLHNLFFVASEPNKIKQYSSNISSITLKRKARITK